MSASQNPAGEVSDTGYDAPPPRGADTAPLVGLLREVDTLLSKLSDAESWWAPWLAAVSTDHRLSARNVVHYWVIRQIDLRDLQSRLAAYGLSSLGRSESHVQANLSAVRSTIQAVLGGGWQPPRPSIRIDDGPELLRQHTVEVLGRKPAHRRTRIMVTLPSEAATNPEVAHDLVERGMNIARINCAHDDAEAWRAMARHVRQAAASAARPCLVAMDLAGPKLRTGPPQPGPRILRLHPRRNTLGQVIAPARAWLTSADDPARPAEPGMASIPVPRGWLNGRRVGDVLSLHDTRGAQRQLILQPDGTGGASGGFVVTATKTTYLATGTRLHVQGSDAPTEVGELPSTEQSLVLHAGDLLKLTRDCSPAPADGDHGSARIGCTLPEIFDHVHPGEAVDFDDGRIRGQIVSVSPDAVTVSIDHPMRGAVKLKAGKGINLPDTDLPIPALTDRDVADLSSMVELADLVEVSFVRTPSDVEQLLDELTRRGDHHLGLVLKIETRQAFEHLPQLLLTAMRRRRVGVMIARGDLAVECAYEHMAELQEEILWLCEAAHLPVIWATQVLEQLAKTGLPSRAEISDAAMSERAECVMLNKGPYISDAVTVLDDILRRMTEHHYKKSALLRPLHAWQVELAHQPSGQVSETRPCC